MKPKSAFLQFVGWFFCTMLMLPAFAQTKKIYGKVLSDDNATPLVGVSIVVKGKLIAARTLSDGTFTITAGDNDLLWILLLPAIFHRKLLLAEEIPSTFH